MVAGGGPVGLLLACELRLADVSVLVVERLAEQDQTIKAGAINLPSVEALYRRGLLPELQRAKDESMAMFAAFIKERFGDDAPVSVPRKIAGHFAGIMLSAERFEDTDGEFAERGTVQGGGLVSQQQIETLLAARAEALGVELRRGVELTNFEPSDDGVTVWLGGERVTVGWLIGADGGRSTVRKLGGFEFPGTGPEITGHQAVVEMTGAEALNVGWNRTDTGIYVHGPMPGRILTVEFDGPPAERDAPITAGELRQSLRHVSGVDVTITAVHSATRFTDNARQATEHRRGRVLLAGDAAHVHSPFGGQGLNLGLGDAMNLGWKLAATIRGWAPDDLLDSYRNERHPIGEWVLEWTRAQIAVMRPEPQARALRRIMEDLMETVTGTSYFVRKISGVWQRYDLSGNHPLVGGSAPDLALTDDTRPADYGHDGKAVVLDLADDPKLRSLLWGWSDRVRVVTAGCPDRPELAGMLIRPDGYVAWAAEGSADLPGLEAVLHRWLGAPRQR